MHVHLERLAVTHDEQRVAKWSVGWVGERDNRDRETATHADVVIQPLPGNDALILSGLIRMVLSEGWEDKEFCARYVGATSMAALREAVDPFTQSAVEVRAGTPSASMRCWILRTGQLALRATAPLV